MTDGCCKGKQNELSYFDSWRSQTVCLYQFAVLYFARLYIGNLHSAVNNNVCKKINQKNRQCNVKMT